MEAETLALLFQAESKIILKIYFLFEIQIFIFFVKVNNEVNYFRFTLSLEHPGCSFRVVHRFRLCRFLLNFDCVGQFGQIILHFIDVVGRTFIANLFFHFLKTFHERALLVNQGIILLTVLWLDI